ncbi:MAG: glutamine synthetase type III [Ruminococcaceae bacterium]|nr:glutamine synthetase type III [Oscillospiraceae bacterium]
MTESGDSLLETYASNVFDDGAMRKYLPSDTYKQLRKTINDGRDLDPAIADAVANGMKRWALDKGATHFTHWFQPMTGYTAEKHEAFINPQRDGSIILSFSGKELVRGEADASSLPSGGIRATFEARGYTAWDCTSPAFVKEGTLCIPTCFFSYSGDALDKKTPLLRSMEALSREAIRVLRAMGDQDARRVIAMSGAEQEYFLVSRELCRKRQDLMLCGRTLYGAAPAKGQELYDHYYGSLKENVGSFMRQVDRELWSLGVPSKTEHNEVAPAQHELAPVFNTANIACDNNQLIMETLKKVALRNDMVCLLHEKPFARVNGSGKHNNWSINIDGGESLLRQGKTPASNARFLLFLSAFIWAVDDWAELLRMTIAGPGNDHRLGGHEAPPCIISVFLGDLLTDILHEIETGGQSDFREGGSLRVGISSMPTLPQDISDRNRTSPMAYTGNKFEFRMLGSSMSIADCNTVTNLMMSDVLSKIADRLEACDDVQTEIREIIRDIMKAHKRVIFNGNNYAPAWVEEAHRRGLPDIDNSVDAFDAAVAPRTVELFERFGVLSRRELEARYGIYHDNYVNTVSIEARTMVEMAKRQILPAVIKYTRFVSETFNCLRDTGLTLDVTLQSAMLKDVTAAAAQFRAHLSKLEKLLDKAGAAPFEDLKARSVYYRDKVAPAMESLRDVADKLETLLGDEFWPIPTYTDLMFTE